MAAAWISASLLLCLLDFDFAFSEDQIIKAVIGENPILQCKAENRPILFVEWKRTDIKEGNVLRYRNDAVDRDNQHQSFKERVIFQDIEMKDGDVSLVLINVRMNDNGTYEAEVVYNGTDSVKKLICSIHLHVAPPPPPGSSPSWATALLVIGVPVLILSGFLLYRNRRRWRRRRCRICHCLLSKFGWCRRIVERHLSCGVSDFLRRPGLDDGYHEVAERLKKQEDPNIYEVSDFLRRPGLDDGYHEVPDFNRKPGEDDVYDDDSFRRWGELNNSYKVPDFNRKPGEDDVYDEVPDFNRKPGEDDVYDDVPDFNRKPGEDDVYDDVLSDEPEEVEKGEESVLLSCRTTDKLPGDARVEWTDWMGRKVHVFENGSDQPEKQDEFYSNRTKMNEDPLRTGDLSLTLSYPTYGDSGIYSCRVYSKEGKIMMKRYAYLKVKDPVEVEEGAESVLLPFGTTSPEELGEVTVEWIDVGRDRKIHVYKTGSDQPEDPSNETRIKMNNDALKTGDLSLILMNPTMEDSGEYRCRVMKDEKQLRMMIVQLTVKAKTGSVRNQTEDIKTRTTYQTPLLAEQAV